MIAKMLAINSSVILYAHFMHETLKTTESIDLFMLLFIVPDRQFKMLLARSFMLLNKSFQYSSHVLLNGIRTQRAINIGIRHIEFSNSNIMQERRKTLKRAWDHRSAVESY